MPPGGVTPSLDVFVQRRHVAGPQADAPLRRVRRRRRLMLALKAVALLLILLLTPVHHSILRFYGRISLNLALIFDSIGIVYLLSCLEHMKEGIYFFSGLFERICAEIGHV